MKKYLSIAALFSAAILSSCSYEKNAVQDITGTVPAARIKFFNFSVGAPGVNFYANDTKMTAVLSTSGTEAVTGTIYGGAAAGGFYSGIAAGSYSFSGRIAAATDKDLGISKAAGTIEDGKFYSFYQSGFYNTTSKTTESFLVEDAVPAVDVNVAYVRFVNAISNSSPMILYAKNQLTLSESALGGAVAYKAGGTFTSLPTGVYDLNTRVTGSSTNVISRVGVSFNAGRVYTIGARGDITSVVVAPALDNTANR